MTSVLRVFCATKMINAMAMTAAVPAATHAIPARVRGTRPGRVSVSAVAGAPVVPGRGADDTGGPGGVSDAWKEDDMTDRLRNCRKSWHIEGGCRRVRINSAYAYFEYTDHLISLFRAGLLLLYTGVSIS
ncbi:MAG: hypothetical protein GEV28_19985 [Actinophytocola sp.]|uniref:hypothetical protein n=1 Tax=Actinophytocola sp. TaxID=1872138 RepID=UPI0013213FA9|nr:hypothetical protein [Actinophytocola sp.]MPZ82555.1 hypothetical protein [Actinophytocola sp.]